MDQFLSDYVGQTVFSANGTVKGYVFDTLLSKKLDEVKALLCADEEEEEFIVTVGNIAEITEAGIRIKSTAKKMPNNTIPAPMGIRVLSEKGNFLGVVRDYVRNENALQAVVLSDKERYPIEKIRAFGDCLLFKPNLKPPVKRTPPQRKKPDTSAVNAVAATDAEPVRERAQTAAPPPAEPLIAGTTAGRNRPEKTIASQKNAGSMLLTGKRVPRDIADVRGNLIIRRGSVVTPEVLRCAVFHNKLFELTVTVLNHELI